MSVSLWAGVAVDVQSALATALPISAITKANPAVVSYTGTDPANGDYIAISAQGMSQIDGRVFRVANVVAASNTLELEGEDSTNYSTFTSGTAQIITFGVTLTTASGVNASGGDFDFIDVTTIHDLQKKQIPGGASPAVYNFELLWDPADAAQRALKAASDTKGQRAIKITFPGPKIVAFQGYIGATGLPTGQAQDKVITPMAVTMFGRATQYAA